MRVRIQVVIENDEGQVEDVQQVACLRRGPLTPEELGLNLAETKQILHGVQESMVASAATGRAPEISEFPISGAVADRRNPRLHLARQSAVKAGPGNLRRFRPKRLSNGGKPFLLDER